MYIYVLLDWHYFLKPQVVYQEGVGFIEQHTDDHLAPLAFDYLGAEKRVASVSYFLAYMTSYF